MQHSLIVTGEYTSNEELNKALRRGWEVVSMCPMPSGEESVYKPQILVVIHKLHADWNGEDRKMVDGK